MKPLPKFSLFVSVNYCAPPPLFFLCFKFMLVYETISKILFRCVDYCDYVVFLHCYVFMVVLIVCVKLIDVGGELDVQLHIDPI